MKLEVVKIEKPEEINFILAVSHFIKTTEDVYEAIVSSSPNIKFGFAFSEASGPRKIRFEGNDQEMIDLAIKNAKKIAVGHSLIIFLKNAYPINILTKLKLVDEIVNIQAATANPTQVIIGQTDQGRAILGVVDGGPPTGVETKEEIKERRRFLREIKYKLS